MSGGDNLDFEIRPNPAPVSDAERSTLLANPGFGRIFTDHMITIRTRRRSLPTSAPSF